MATELSGWARSGSAPKIGPFRAIEAMYELTGGPERWGRPIRRDLLVWTFSNGCIAFDPRDERAYVRSGSGRVETVPGGGARVG
jgi:hypothetical protein